MTNWLDRSIGWIAPTWGAKRALARAMLLAYEGAKSGRRTAGWVASGTSADAEISVAAKMMRDRARDLARNSPHASKALVTKVSNTIGTGILCQPDGPNQRMNRRLDERWKRWVDHCDATGRLDFYGLQSLVERTRCESGEALVLILRSRFVDMADVPIRLQVLEPDHIDATRNGNVTGSANVIRDGIEYAGDVPVAYYLSDAHPGDINSTFSLRNGLTSRRVPAEDVLHIYKVLRPGQRRGMTDFAPVMMRLRMLDDADDAEVMRRKIAACLAAFVTTPAGLPGASLAPTATDEDGNRVETFRPGMVGYLKPGESVTVADPKPSSDYAPFNNVQLHAIAAGLGLPHELLTGDLSQVNYSSMRGGLVQFRAQVEADQWQLIVPQLLRPITQRFTFESARLDGTINRETPWTYTPPRFGLLDPAKEIPALIEAIQSGVDSYPNVIRREGYDWQEKLDEIEAFQRELDRRGVVLTSDPRTQQKQGTAEPAEPTEDDEATEEAGAQAA